MKELLSNIPFLFSVCWFFFSLRDMYSTAKEILLETTGISHAAWTFLDYLLSCAKCFAFWFALITSRDLVLAVATSIAFDVYFSVRLRYL